jgi:hypothetical protein
MRSKCVLVPGCPRVVAAGQLKRFGSSVATALVALLLLTAPVSADAPAITLEPQAVSVSGGTPGGSVILFAVAKVPRRYSSETQTVFRTATADADGLLRFELPAPVPRRAIYAVVDVESGDHAIATPDGFAPQIQAIPPGALKKPGDGFEELDLDIGWIEALCVRPKKGAWRMFVLDGAGADQDRQPNGRTRIAATSMTPLHGTQEALGKFKRHDVVIIIDPAKMAVAVTAVPE